MRAWKGKAYIFIQDLRLNVPSRGYEDPLSIFGVLLSALNQINSFHILYHKFTLVGGVGNQDMAKHVFITLPILAIKIM